MQHTLYFSAPSYNLSNVTVSTHKDRWDPTFLTMEIDLPYAPPSAEDWKKIIFAHELDRAKKKVADQRYILPGSYWIVARGAVGVWQNQVKYFFLFFLFFPR